LLFHYQIKLEKVESISLPAAEVPHD